jgi:RNA polymerase sigma-70 factor (ECF subfamily)
MCFPDSKSVTVRYSPWEQAKSDIVVIFLIVLPDIATEDELMRQASQGNHDALREIYDTYFPAVFRYLRLRVNQVQEAEDLTADVFLKLVAAFQHRRMPRKSLRGWLFRVAHNLMVDHYGKKQRFTLTALTEWIPATEHADPEIQLVRSVGAEAARAAVQSLAFEQQEVIILRFGHMLSLQETADIMNKSISAVKSLQFRALNNLRKTLEQTQIEHPDG